MRTLAERVHFRICTLDRIVVESMRTDHYNSAAADDRALFEEVYRALTGTGVHNPVPREASDVDAGQVTA